MSAHHFSSLTTFWSSSLLLLAFIVTSPAAIITVTDPTGTAGTDVNTAGRTFESTHGNVSLAALNADPGQFTIPFDNTSEFTGTDTIAAVQYTSGSDLGQTLSIDFSAPNSNWWALQGNPFRTTSTNQSVGLRHLTGNTLGISFSTAAETVGFTMNVLLTGDSWDVSFYSDAAGTNLLDSFTGITGTGSPSDLNNASRAFIGYTNVQGIELIEISATALNSSVASRQLDDLSFVLIPEPTSGALLLSAGLLMLSRRRSNR